MNEFIYSNGKTGGYPYIGHKGGKPYIGGRYTDPLNEFCNYKYEDREIEGNQFVYEVPGRYKITKNPTQVPGEDYLFEAEFEEYSYEPYSEFIRRLSCSSVRNGNFYGRNFDWTYDESVSVVIKVSAKEGRHASIGMSGSVSGLTKDGALNNTNPKCYRMLPYFTVDGINDAGVVCNSNVVYLGDRGYTTGTNPGKPVVYTISLIRYILDYADSAEDGVKKLVNDINIVNTPLFGEDLHYMIADKDDTFIVEVLENKVYYLGNRAIEGFEDRYKGNFPNNKPIMTNFYISDWNGEMKGDNWDSLRDNETLCDHPMGIERYKILSNGWDSVTDEEGMINLMKQVYYTKTYKRDTNPIWCSEYVMDSKIFGKLDKTVDEEGYAPIVEYGYNAFENRKRDGQSWQTVWSCVYNIEEKKMVVFAQEGETKHEFSLEV